MTDSTSLDSKKNASSPLTKINVVVETVKDKSSDAQKETPNKNSLASSKTNAKEYGGRGGLEPTRFGDWEKNGRCIDF